MASAVSSWAADLVSGDCPDVVWITCGEQTRRTDGSITQHYWLRSNSENRLQCFPDLQWEAYYRLTDGDGLEEGYSRVPLTCSGGVPNLEINCRTNARLELTLVGHCGGKHYTAQLQHALFGKASAGKHAPSERFGELPAGLRRWNLKPSRRNTYQQTGDTYHFIYHGNAGSVESVSVLEKGRRLPEDLSLARDGNLVYTPAHDPHLDRSSPYEVKETVLLAREAAEGWEYLTTFTLLLHRSYSAHLKRLHGCLLFAGMAVLAAGFTVIFKRRPWYR